jgi:hypothetical protein
MPRTPARRSPSILRTFLTPRRFRPAAAHLVRVVVGDGTTTLVATAPSVPAGVEYALAAPPRYTPRRPRTVQHPPVPDGDAPRTAAARTAWARKVARDLIDPSVSIAQALAVVAPPAEPARPSVVRSPWTTPLAELVESAVDRIATVTLRHGDGSVQQLACATTWAAILGAHAGAPARAAGGAL